MATKALFDKISYKTSKLTTLSYSTSFSMGIKFLSKRFHEPIFNIYGFVRFADEIVDTFHEYDKADLLQSFRLDTYKAIKQGISLNPILNSFQKTVNEYSIDLSLIDTFLDSMEMDLNKKSYTKDAYDKYILGSAEVVGLMCLKVFCEGCETQYNQLKDYAMSLGSAFQKINFLRDLKQDTIDLDRAYFPGIDITKFDEETKRAIEKDIEADFDEGYKGILLLPKSSRFGVYLAYVYFRSLFNKIKRVKPERVMTERIRIPNSEKVMLLLNSYVRHNFNLL
ncbi:MAG: phytoene/squalene synthase family protein [Bacteroidetes bacterium]|nr:phytoene/squalene synthase family protein [Bacteroidota bacterium]